MALSSQAYFCFYLFLAHFYLLLFIFSQLPSLGLMTPPQNLFSLPQCYDHTAMYGDQAVPEQVL